MSDAMQDRGTNTGHGPQRIIDMASAFYDSCVLFTASDLGVFNALSKDGESSLPDLAAALSLDMRGLRLVLDACVACGLLVKQGDSYANSEESEQFLVQGAQGDLSGAIRYNRDVYEAWGKLAGLARTGAPVERPAVHLGEDVDRTRTFVLSMHYRALAIGRGVVPMLDMDGVESVLDVGGGPGTFASLIAQANPGLRCTVLDLPDVVAIARELIADTDVADRVDTLGGSYRETEFPGGQDAVNFFGVLHQESPDSIRSLFVRAFAALRPGGRVHVLDMMTDSTHTAPKFSAMFAVNMALTTDNGWVFSDAEASGWLKEAGFCDVTVRPLPPPMPHWLIAARKPMDA